MITSQNQQSYTDEKGRWRWRRNDEIADVVKQLGEYLIIGGYPEQHAKRYAQLSHTISRMPELIDTLAENNELNRIPGVGGVITGYIDEIVCTRSTTKFEDNQYGEPPPMTVLELTAIHKLGAKTARMLYQDYSIDSLKALCIAMENGRLKGVRGIGPKMLRTITSHCNCAN